ncbi:putative acyl-activating enzyme 1 [Morus notabilis]|uniref:Putative acyl-activating enzyme 1 n=2 Tax=Morus notabilis TaxID=981085 RepID=W9SCH3_9ROSA|nr:putative acyl-activating enzyme 1 [Morus notabilis]
MAGAVLSALNFRLDDTMLALILQQLEPKFILVDHQFVHIVLKALNTISQTVPNCKPTLVLIPECDQKTSSSLSSSSSSSSSLSSNNNILNYNDLIEARDHGDLEFEIIRPTDECDPISVNYTSGSTGNPKGVIYSHRAVYLNSLALILNMDKRRVPVFLWTVDMFRCNGWCYPWAIAALGGTNICLRNTNLSAKIILDAISLHKVTHLCGKPIILNILAEALDGKPLASRVDIVIAGALPSHQILTKVTEMGFNISHGYGMTEALGPQIIEPWRPELPHSHIANGDNKGDDDDDKSTKRCRGESLGRYHHNLMIMERFDVKDPSTMESIPNDGETMGEIMFRGNTLMSGYVKNSKATEEAYNGGWYRTGDVGIRHQDGSIRMKDRAEDIVICGGNVISTLEVEAVLLSHPNVLEAAVVGRHDECLGEIPCAFVKLKKGCESTITSSEEIIEFCGNNLPAYYMVPHAVIFGDLPVNSTGKVQKFVLRDKANAANGSYQPRSK